MSTETKTTKKDVPGFIKLSEMTLDQLKALPTMNVALTKRTSKKGFTVFQVETVIHSMLKPSLQIKESKFSNILLTLAKANKIDIKDPKALMKDRYVVPVGYRFIEGPDTFGNTYKSIEMIFALGNAERYFFSYEEQQNLQLMQELGHIKPITWLYQPEAVKDALNPTFDF